MATKKINKTNAVDRHLTSIQQKVETASKVKNTKSVSELKKYQESLEKRKMLFEQAQNALQLIDLTKTESRTYSTFSKDTLRTYLKSPFSYATNLRNLSRYLYRVSNPYRRLIWYNASMFMPEARIVRPAYNPCEDNDSESVLESYYNTLLELEKLNLSSEVFKMLLIAWREDASYGVVYTDDTGTFILPFDGDYAKVSSYNYDGTLNWACDMSYFRTHSEQLEYFGEPFTSMYNTYVSDSTQRWQEVDPTRSCCFKINLDDPTFPLPPYVNMFNSIIDLADLQDIQTLKDEMSIYKLLVATMDTISSSDIADDFTVDPDTAIDYFNTMVENLPEWIGSAISPLKLELIDVYNDETSDVNKISKATETLFNSSGGAQVLNSASISGTTAWTGAMISDGEYALSSTLPQIQGFVNKWLETQLGDSRGKVTFIEATPFTKDTVRKSLLENGCYGLPNRLVINSMAGISELDSLGLMFLEQDCLQLHTKMIPMQSSYTQSSSDSGGQEKDIDELTDDGEASRDKQDNKN